MAPTNEEILLLIVKYLNHINCPELAKGLEDEIDKRQLFPKSISWDGNPLPTAFRNLASQYDHLSGDFLEGICSQFVKFLDDKVPTTTANIKSLLGGGRFHSLRSAQDVNRSIIQSRFNSSAYLYKNSLGTLQNHQIFGGNCFSYQSLYREMTYRATIWGHRDAAYCITFDKTNEFLITGGDDGMVKIWHIKSLRLINCLRGHAGPITDISVSYDNRILVTGSCDSYVIIWCLMSGRPLHTMSLFASNVMINAIVCSPLTIVSSDVYWIVVTASKEGRIVFIPYRYKYLNSDQIPSTSTGLPLTNGTDQNEADDTGEQNPWFNVPGRVDIELLPQVRFIECVRPANSMLCIGFSRGGYYMAGGCHDHIVRVYAFKDEKNVEKIGDLIGHTGAVDSLCYANHSSRFATGSVDGTCRIWWFENHEWRSKVFSINQRSKSTVVGSNQKSPKIVPANISWTCDDQRLITSISDFSIQIWDTTSGTFLFSLPELHTHNVYGLSPSYRSPHLLMTAGRDGRVIVWDLLLRDCVYEHLDADATGYMDGVLSEDGTLFATVDFLGRFSLFQLGAVGLCQRDYISEQFFHWELDSCKWSTSNPAILLHQPSEIPFHRLPPPYLTNYRGFLHDIEVQKSIHGREHFQSEEDLFPTLITAEEDDIIVDDVQLARHVPLGPGENPPIRSNVSGLDGKTYLSKSYWLEHNMILPLRQVDITEDNTFYSSLAHVEIQELETDRPIKVRACFDNEVKKEPEKREKRLHISPIEKLPEVADSNSSDSDISDWTPTVGERALSAPKRKTVKQRRPVTRNSSATNGQSTETSTSRINNSAASNRSKRLIESSTPSHPHHTRSNRSLKESGDDSAASNNASACTSYNTTDDSTCTSTSESSHHSILSNTSGKSKRQSSESIKTEPANSSSKQNRKRLVRHSSSSSTSSNVKIDSVMVPEKTSNRRLKVTSRNLTNGSMKASTSVESKSSSLPAVKSSSKTVENSNEEVPMYPEWLTSVIPRHSPYVPQMGDEVVYFYQGHQLYIEAVKQKNVYSIRPDTKYPWKTFNDLKPYEYLRVVGLRFAITQESSEYPQTRLCNLKLGFFNPETGDILRRKRHIEFVFHDMDNVLDFVILRHSFDSALKRNWKTGDTFRSIVDDKWYSGTIRSQSPFNDTIPDSPWQCFTVEWATGETERISPWDLLPMRGDNSSHVQGVAATAEELAALQYEPVMNLADPGACDWPPGRGRNVECDRIAACIAQIKELSVAENFISPVDLELYPDYAQIIAYPIDLMIIEERLRNRYYRRSNAVHFEMRLIATNAELYNAENSKISQDAQLISNLCESVVSDHSMYHIMPTYKRMTAKPIQSSQSSSIESQVKQTNRTQSSSLISPLNLSWPSQCRNLLKDLKSQDFSFYFRQPIDLKEFKDYLFFVTDPMDLSTIADKLKNKQYRTPNDFYQDLKLIVNNSKKYNTDRKFIVYSYTENFNDYVKEKMTNIINEYHDEIMDNQRNFHKRDRRNRERRRPFSTSRFRNAAAQHSNSRRIGRRRGLYTEQDSDDDVYDEEDTRQSKELMYKTRYGRQINVPHMTSSSDNDQSPQTSCPQQISQSKSSLRRVAFQNDVSEYDTEPEEEADEEMSDSLQYEAGDDKSKTRTKTSVMKQVSSPPIGTRVKRSTRYSGSFLDNADDYGSDDDLPDKQKRKRKLQPLNATSTPIDIGRGTSSRRSKSRVLNLSEQENDSRNQDSPDNSPNLYPKRSASRLNYCEESDQEITPSKRVRRCSPSPVTSVSRSGRIRKEPAFFRECER